jgi:hypothetical protein
MTIYITQILSDVENNYCGLDDTDIEIFTDYEEAKKYLESKHDDIKYNHFKYAEKVKENEDYLDVDFCENIGDGTNCDFAFRISDGKDYFSGQILKKEI